jgi:histidinol-phosphate aminotransferase/imidazoleglycerol-phosphate dehydratase/histidinol-phosphatase
MKIFDKLMRPDLRKLAPYSSARTEADGAVALALDANESTEAPFGPWGALCAANRYPDPQPQALRARLAALWKIAPEKLLLTRGSDEGIELLIRLFCRAGQDAILICPPTYGMYEVSAAVQGAKVQRVPLRTEDGQLDLPAIAKKATRATKLIFIPAPNAPMGHAMNEADLLKLAKARRTTSLIVVDEAYVAFSAKPEGLARALARNPNLVILRTLSKAYALAGERVAGVLGDAALIAALRRIQAPYPLTQSSIRVASDALSPAGTLLAEERVARIVRERGRLRALLAKADEVVRVFPSQGNFLTVLTTDAPAFMARLATQSIRVRSRHSIVKNCVRLSLGTATENDLVLRALGVPLVMPTKPARQANVARRTKETQIDVTVDLENAGKRTIDTGIGFFDHMVDQVALHGGFSLTLMCAGDLKTGQHHTIEDCALALGEALRQALGDRAGIGRYGFSAPLDEALASVVVDLSGRPAAVFDGAVPQGLLGDMEADMVPHFFQSLAAALHAALHLTLKGDNAHHTVEAAFKALGRALAPALKRDDAKTAVPSSKGLL